jgi:hypothetical protein
MVKVKVDGEEFEVPLEEAAKGYQRQEHFTREMQKLADVRAKAETLEKLESWIQDSPTEAIQKLAEQYGVKLGSSTQEPDPSSDKVDLEAMDPMERQLYEIQQRLEAQDQERKAEAAAQLQAQQKAAYESELASLHEKFGGEQSAVEYEERLLEFCTENDVHSLQKGAEFLQIQDLLKAGEKVVEERKRNAPPVEGGTHRPANSTKAGATATPSLDDSINQALADLGVT